jgi:hypothetical protein
MVVVFGASGATGLRLVEHLNTQGIPTRAVVRSATTWPAHLYAPTLRIARADLTRTANFMRFMEEATHIVFLAGSRPALTAMGGRLMVDYGAFMTCLETAHRNRFSGSLLYVGVEQRPPRTLGERVSDLRRSRWTVFKSACERELVASGLRYLILRARALSNDAVGAMRFRLGGRVTADEDCAGAVPRGAIAALLAGAIIHGHTPRASAAVHGGRAGVALKQAVTMLRELAPDRIDRHDPDMHPDRVWQAARRETSQRLFELHH